MLPAIKALSDEPLRFQRVLRVVVFSIWGLGLRAWGLGFRARKLNVEAGKLEHQSLHALEVSSSSLVYAPTFWG